MSELHSGIPFIDQYLGVWAMLPSSLQSLKSLCEQINLNMHIGQPATTALTASDTFAGVDKNGIARVDLHGTLLKHRSSFSANTSTVEARRVIRSLSRNPDVEGVLLHIDSPGGTVAGTEDLALDIRSLAAKKPVIAYIEDLGASAAYWLAAQATMVYSNPAAVVGSIGVLSVVYDLSRKAEAENIIVHVIKAGEMKGAGVPGSPVTDEQLAEFQKLVDAFYRDFVNAVAHGRNLPKARARELADGRVHAASVAADLGLTDGVRSLDESFSELIALSGRGTTSSKRKAKMTDTQKVEDVAPKAATPAELKAALPNADDAFLFSQVSCGATLLEAKEAWADERERQIQEREESLAAKEKEVEKAATAKQEEKPAIKKPLEDVAESSVTFESLVAELMKDRGCDRRTASLRVARAHPDLHNQFLDTCPEGRTVKQSRRS